MRKAFFILAALASLHASATPGLNLAPMPGDKKVDVVNTANYSGSCGSAIVRVLGVEQVYDDTFRFEFDSGKLVVRGEGKELELTAREQLDAIAGVSCVQTRAGKRLLVWTNCGGNGCPSFDYLVIDPEKAVVLAPKNPDKDLCDEQCATKALGRKLPVNPTR